MGFIYLCHVLSSAAGPPLFCHTGDISLLVPSREGPLGNNEWPGRCHSLTEGCSPWKGGVDLAGEDMPAALPEEGCGTGAFLSAGWLAAFVPYGEFVLGHFGAGDSE